MALTIPMPIKLDEFLNDAANAGLTSTPHYVTGTPTCQPCQRKCETVSPRRLKQKCPTLQAGVTKHRMEARKLAKTRRNNQLRMRRQNRVRFHSSVKTHDGISTANAHLERLIFDFWKNQKLDLLVELSHNFRHNDLDNLVTSLRELVQRMRKAGDKTTILLPRGGGRAAKLSKLHFPHINHLLQRTIQVRNDCTRRHEALFFTTKMTDSFGLFLQDVPDLDDGLDAAATEC